MNRALLVMLAIAAGTVSTGCATALAGAFAITTPDEIKTSKNTARFSVDNSQAAVSACLKNLLTAYKSERGTTPYASFTYRDVSQPFQFVVSNNVGSSWSGLRPELLFMVETQSRQPSGTDIQLWTHPHILNNGGAQGFFERIRGILNPCLTSFAEPANLSGSSAQATPSNAQKSEDSMKKLEQLKGLADRGVISKDDYEKKKKEILDSL